MFKPLLVPGWFRVQSFFKYTAIVIVISPLAGMSLHATLAKQLKLVDNGQANTKSAESTNTRKLNLQFAQVDSHTGKISVGEGIQTSSTKIILGTKRESSHLENHAVGKIVPSINIAQLQSQKSIDIVSLIPKLKDGREQTDLNSRESGNYQSQELTTLIVTPKNGEIPVSEQPNESDMKQTDPIGSPHPIPWQWIMSTQEAIGGKGNYGICYYRSIPVLSPDGKYAIYSRVQMEIKPEMHNSRVNSVLFVEDRETRRLRVMSSTGTVIDPLLKKRPSLSAEVDNDGKIEVLVPISWSEKGDRFLVRKFVAVFNTADVTDQAVIWNRQENNLSVVHPSQSQDDHEKIDILLGWSKKQPNNILFRSGELGQENWHLLQVANDGKTVDISAEGDQAVTFGRKGSIWVDPEVVSRSLL
jgi:hypothetical protein